LRQIVAHPGYADRWIDAECHVVLQGLTWSGRASAIVG
jgi:hypothetical protein